MRHARVAAIAAVVFCLYHPLRSSADQNAAPAATAPATFALWPATFQGVTPCGDCPGVRTTVTLKADGTYSLERAYLERKTTLEESGTWSYDAKRARLTLLPSKGSAELFSVSFSADLHMLDADGNPLPAKMNSMLSQVEPVATLAASGWELVELGGKPFPATEGHAVTMQFDPDGERVYGSGGCNRYAGAYESSGDKLTFGVIASTKMMCPTLDQEQAFFSMLGKVASYERVGDSLTLFDGSGTAIARLGFAK